MMDKKCKILIVDDMKTMRMALKKCFRDLGYENMTEADDGASAWPKLEEAISNGEPFDLICSDWNMPVMQGIDLLRKVRGHAKIQSTPFILVTAESDKSQVLEALKAGVSNYLTKPFTAASLSEKINAVAAKKQS